MRLLMAIILPPLVFFTIWRPFQGFFCALLYMTFIGWPVASMWAIYALSQHRNDELRDEFDYSRGYRRY